MSQALPVAAFDENNRPRRLNDVFRCSQRTRNLLLSSCLDDYMNANALRIRTTVCFECPQGFGNREAFAADADTEGLLDSEIWARLMSDVKDDN